jgi:outer membrane beta-barrel protein
MAAATLASLPARAAVIEFPDEERATESVLPVFDQPQSVKLRKVSLSSRFEIGPIGGYSLLEAFFNPYSVGLTGTFHFNEEHGLNFLYLNCLSGSSSYAGQLNPIPGSNPATDLNAQLAPGPLFLALASWQYTGYYGKMSLSRDTVMNLSLYGLLGLGGYGIGDAVEPTLSLGLGQKFYFNKSIALRADLRMLMYQGPDITSKDLSKATTVQSSSAFNQTFIFGSLLTVGATFFFGG